MNETSASGAVADNIRALIVSQLEDIERRENVRILFAIESGSRAWGFASPDSDYDVRFVYVHDPDWYLSIDPRRDVIEIPIENDLDINGWDLKKALQLLIKSNPVMLEWLRSPVVYRADEASMKAIAALAERCEHMRPSTHHYLRLAESQFRRHVKAKRTVALKKYFYSLRPALALMWMRVHPDIPVPMDLPTLRAGVALPNDVIGSVDDLLIRKAVSKELGKGPRVKALDEFIEQEVEFAQSRIGDLPRIDKVLFDDANALFREIVNRAQAPR